MYAAQAQSITSACPVRPIGAVLCNEVTLASSSDLHACLGPYLVTVRRVNNPT